MNIKVFFFFLASFDKNLSALLSSTCNEIKVCILFLFFSPFQKTNIQCSFSILEDHYWVFFLYFERSTLRTFSLFWKDQHCIFFLHFLRSTLNLFLPSFLPRSEPRPFPVVKLSGVASPRLGAKMDDQMAVQGQPFSSAQILLHGLTEAGTLTHRSLGNFYKMILYIFMTDGVSIHYQRKFAEVVLHNLDDMKTTLDQEMAWCHQAPSHYLVQRWPRSTTLYGFIYLATVSLMSEAWKNLTCRKFN